MDLKIIEDLVNIIRDRKKNPTEKSYTYRLFSEGENKIVKKLGEEYVEFLRAYLKESDNRVVSEASDFLYHILVALEFRGVAFEDVLDELRMRHRRE